MDGYAIGLAALSMGGATVLALRLSAYSTRKQIDILIRQPVPPHILPAASPQTVKQILLGSPRLPLSPVEEEMTQETDMSTERDLLARIDERTRAQATLVEQKDIFLRGELEKVSRALQALPSELDAKLKGYATTEALGAVSKRLENVEGTSRTIGMAVILAVLSAVGALVFKGGG